MKNILWKQRRQYLKLVRERLNDIGRNASIICNNCTGGIIRHDCGLRFLSHTINMLMNAEDFIRFCENLEHYLSIESFQEWTDINADYPVALLDDITLHLVHYKSVQEAQDKWNERKKRINWNNIVIFGSDCDGMTDELKNRFEQLPYKIMFTHVADDCHPSCFKISGYEKDDCVGIVTEPRGHKGLCPVDEFDYVCLMNEGVANA